MNVELKNVKRNGLEHSATLFVDGKPAARVYDSGHGGGGAEVRFSDPAVAAAFYEWVQTLPPYHSTIGGGCEIPMTSSFWFDLEFKKSSKAAK